MVAVGYPLVRGNPALALSSFRVQSMRPPWQSIWALFDGYYDFGQVLLDNRNPAGLSNQVWESVLPWPLISALFLLFYLWIYTRPYRWDQPHTLVAFTGASVIWLFLYNKGWSPQFVLWMLAMIALLMPNGRGVAIAVALMLDNFIESTLYIIVLRQEIWILWGTVLLRTALLMLLGLEFLGRSGPPPPHAPCAARHAHFRGPRWRRRCWR